MRDFVHRLFSENGSSLEIGLFDIWHFLYLFIIFGATIALALVFGKKTSAAKDRLLRIVAYLATSMYVADFFIMPLSDSYSGISVYKLPFNICTIMAVLLPFVQFNDKLRFLKTPVITLSIASSLMWMCYPGSALGGQPPFSYIIFQTFMYHGLLFCWGVLSLALGSARLEFKKIWKEFVGILCILVWAAFGNTIYDGEQNWFFIESSIFSFLPDKIMPIMVVLSVFGVCLIVYGAYYALRAVFRKTEG